MPDHVLTSRAIDLRRARTCRLHDYLPCGRLRRYVYRAGRAMHHVLLSWQCNRIDRATSTSTSQFGPATIGGLIFRRRDKEKRLLPSC
jgi:hypothetical protein